MRKIVITALAVWGMLFSVGQAAVLSVGSYTSFDATGLPGGDLGTAMQDPAKFAQFGYDGVADAGQVGFGGLTAGYLSTVDMFFTDRSAISSSPSAGDIALLQDFVNGGGVLVINNDRSTSFTSLGPLLNAFGIGLVALPTGAIEPLNIVNPAHPIIQGPFGTVTSMGLSDASRYSIAGPGVESVANWQNGDSAIATVGPDGTRLGGVIVLPDVERFLLQFDSPLGTGDTDIATLNAIAYGVGIVNGDYAVSGQVPAPGMIWLLSLGVLALSAVRRRA